jgi:ribosomal protein L11 methyltransferase
LAVVIDPGRAFGTGAHETTRLCLEFLVDIARGSLVDIGCGSGVLAIAAARLGFNPVEAIDHDSAAVEAALHNVRANDVPVGVSLLDALDEPIPSAETAVANLSLSAVERVAAGIDAVTLITSGYLGSEALNLRGYRHVQRRTAGAWAADLAVRAS